MAEKIGRSLVDKLSPGQKEPRTGCRTHGPGPSQLVPTYVYPVQYGSPGYGNQQPGSHLHYPWEIYNGQIIEYHDLNFNASPVPSSCACQVKMNFRYLEIIFVVKIWWVLKQPSLNSSVLYSVFQDRPDRGHKNMFKNMIGICSKIRKKV